ncbi:MAG: hypothetical protein HY075_14730, partial [Deltaproteobacteria bacterium]|nr:hypothetical protein [Deltaproteobacteria bacterium]
FETYLGSRRYFQELRFKFAFHDLLNDDTGYIKNSQIDFPALTLRYLPAEGRLRVEQLDGIAITSLFPMDFLEKRLSWRAALDYYTPRDFGCDGCHLFRFEAGAGATVEVFTPAVSAYVLGLGDIEAGNALHKGFRWGPKLQAAAIVHPFARFKSQPSYSLVADLGQSDRRHAYGVFEWNNSYALARNWELRAGFRALTDFHEEKVTLNFYF